MKASQIKEKVLGLTNPASFVFDEKAKGPLIRHMNECFGGDENRKLILGYLFSQQDPFEPLSTKMLPNTHWSKLWRWISPMKNPEGKGYLISANFIHEADVLANAVPQLHNPDPDKLPATTFRTRLMAPTKKANLVKELAVLRIGLEEVDQTPTPHEIEKAVARIAEITKILGYDPQTIENPEDIPF